MSGGDDSGRGSVRRPGDPRGGDRLGGSDPFGGEDRLAEAKEETIEVLKECFARDALDVDDMERRMEVVHAARTMADLGRAIEGIRAEGTAAAAAGRDPVMAAVRRATPDLPAERVRPSDRTLAVFGGTTRAGQWTPARSNMSIAVFGTAVLDLREALLGPGETQVTAYALMGTVEIVVPPGLHVECTGSAAFGSFGEQRRTAAMPMVPDAPAVRVSGFSLFGSVEVEYRYPGESRREARRRRKREARDARREAKVEAKRRKRERKRLKRERRRRR